MPTTTSTSPQPIVAYVMSDYPSPSHSFLREEVLAVRAAGIDVLPISVNPAGAADLLTDVDRAEHARTFEVKATTPSHAVMAIGRLTLRHPIRMGRFLVRSVRSGGTDVARIVKRVLQGVEGILVWQHASQHGVRHLHAHFAGTPGHVTRAAVDAAWLFGDQRWTWSITIHGPHDFMNEVEAGLPDVLRDADAVVAITDFTAAQLLRSAPPERRGAVHVIRCGIDLERFPPRSDDRVGEPLRLLNVGRLAPEKGQWVLLEALEQVVASGIDAHLRIIGGGPLRAELEREIGERGLDDRVELVGIVPPSRVRAELEQADVYCMPSFAEGLPISIMEALAVGVPVVCTSIAGIPELVVDGVTGCCVPAGSVTDFAAAIERLANDPTYRGAVVAAGRERVIARHDIHISAAALAELFTEVACARERRSDG